MPPLRRSRQHAARTMQQHPYLNPDSSDDDLLGGIEGLIIDIPDDEEVEIVHESSAIAASRVSRHRAVDRLHLNFSLFVSPHWRLITQDTLSGIAVGDVVALGAMQGYLQVKAMLANCADDKIVVMRGVRLVESAKLLAGFNCQPSELSMLQEVYKGSVPSFDGLYLENFTYKDLRQPISKHHVSFSNVPSIYASLLPSGPRTEQSLLCSSKYVTFYDNIPWGGSRPARKTQEIWTNLSKSEADRALAVSERHLRQQHGEGASDGGRGNTARNASASRSYTCWDIFCGAGFASWGAKSAGFSVTRAFDKDICAIHSYRKNHFETEAKHMEFDKVIRKCTSWSRPDMLMLSPPCQFFSLVHTVAGRDDEANEVVMFGIADLVSKVRPRVVVIEQTFGLEVRACFADHLTAFIAGLRNCGYSVRKGVINFAGLGEASTRRRLIIIAAAPGEELPPFPEQIFALDFASSDPELCPAVSVHDRLQLCVANHPDHARYLPSRPLEGRLRFPTWDPTITKLHTILCGRGGSKTDHHWSGTRPWTPHELMLMQGAPPTYQLSRRAPKTKKFKQIGNAFPCLAAEQIYAMVIKSLRRTDAENRRLDGREATSGAGSSPQAPIWL